MAAPLRRVLQRLDAHLERHGSVLLMLLAQLVSALLAAIGRILRTGHGEADGEGVAMGTSEILLAMMLTTALLSWSTVYHLRLPFSSPSSPSNSPSTHRSTTKLLLLLRSTSGFAGIWGFYYSLRALSLAEASILNFLAPVLAVLLLSLLPGSPSSSSTARRISPAHILAGLVSLTGVICVLQPWNNTSTSTSPSNDTTERTLAIAAALFGVAGGAISYVAMARLGSLVHPIVTVAWFASTCVLGSFLLLLLQLVGGGAALRLPQTPLQWALVAILGVLGFAMHWLMTASLAHGEEEGSGDGAKRALNFVYTQIVFAMGADRIIWGVSPDGWKYLGGALIIGSAIFVASTKGRQGGYALVSEGEGEGDEEEDGMGDLELELSKERVRVAEVMDP